MRRLLAARRWPRSWWPAAAPARASATRAARPSSSPIANAGGAKRTIFVYLLRYGQLVKVERTVPGAQAPEREALLALLDGPERSARRA